MATTVRWARSPDGCALLVVEDPVGVEAEPIPDAVLHVASTAAGIRATRIDSVWDVAPDPAWGRLAVGQAFLARGGEADTLPDAAWAALARSVGRTVRDVRAAAFAASGMAAAAALARPAIWRVGAADPDAGAAPRAEPLPLLGGWRVRWAPGADELLVGTGPARVGDDEPPRAWLRVDARTGRPLAAAAAPAQPPPAAAWQEAPLLDASTTVDLAASRTIAVRGGRVVGARGAVTRVDAAGGERSLGPGVPLAATEDGRAVLAIAPRPGALREYEVRWRVVVYVVE